MPSERVQRRIDVLLDQAESAVDAHQWSEVAEACRAVLAIDAGNEDASAFLQMAVANGVADLGQPSRPAAVSTEEPAISVIQAAAIVEQLEAATPESDPESFAGGRYRVLRFLGEGGKKRVFLAHDTLLDRDIAFSLIKTDGLDDVGRERIMREAQAMGRLAHQNIVAIYDIGEHTRADGSKQLYLVQELMGGGDVEGLLEHADGALPLQQSLDIAIATARGLEFAHAQGVIHRDLKPGNVWLTADGVAKIGDLGLAVTLGQSRLTSHGMMVGTYGYMPPEQALGQEVTVHADLYSLGAMLYELVTGRPPFQGDTPTAVISQHLNTQPVAPSWHSEHCPPDLEALVLRLLAKVSTDRPASATEVIAALTAVDSEGRSASHSDSQANPLDRLAHGVFVGRERELEQLHSSLDGALQGRGSVVMLVGEPGIGKTRTVQELETYARMRGANVYWGRTHESAGMPAYWPWYQVGRAWSATQDFSQAATQAAVANPELQRLFPALRQMVPGLPEPGPVMESESAQFMLFDAYTQFIRAQSTETPWVVVLDDLHWADKPTLQLLQFVARELSNMSVLIVATYRDTDLVRTHPLSETLAELNREGAFQRIALKGLDAGQVATYVRQRAAVEPSPALLARIYEETEGNPFFLSEIVNLMTEEGTLSSADSRSVSDIALPDGVREALGRRLDRLSEEANELLQVAAIAGREFAYETLTLLDERDPDELLQLVEQALNARVIEEAERPGRYRFTHALMQETLLGELSTTRRVRLHGRVARALEKRYADRIEQEAPRLAMHYLEASTLGEEQARKAGEYSWMAANEALAKAADAEAIRYLSSCLELESEGVPGLDRAQILFALGQAKQRAGSDSETAEAYDHMGEAVQLFAARSDEVSELKAIIAYTRWHQTQPVSGPELRSVIDATLERSSLEARTRLELLLNGAASVTFPPRHPELADAYLDEAEALATEADRPRIDLVRARIAAFSGQHAESVDLAERAFDGFTVAGDVGGQNDANSLRVPVGAITDADEWVTRSVQAAEFSERHGFHRDAILRRFGTARVHIARGDWFAVEETYSLLPPDYAIRLADESLVADIRGDNRRATEIAERATATSIASRGAVLGSRLRAAFVGERLESARKTADEIVDHFAASRLTIPGTLHAGDFAAIELLSPEVLDRGGEGQIWDRRLQAPVYALRWIKLGQPERAADVCRIGLEWASANQLLVVEGRCHAILADLEAEQGNLRLAEEHLDRAGDLLQRCGAKLYLDQVIAKKEILKA